MAEDIKDLYKAFILKKLTVGVVLAYQYCSTEPPILEYWHRSTENSHCPIFIFALPDVVDLSIHHEWLGNPR